MVLRSGFLSRRILWKEVFFMAAKSILIKKYENRRLYDATNSRYVNLEEVAAFVQRGYEVRVIDASSGEDITRVVLTQIIAEGAKTPDSGFPLDILRQMVMASGRASQENALRYTKAMLDLYQSTYRAMAPALNPFEFLQKAPGTGGQAAKDMTDASAPPEVSRSDQETEEMGRLKKRLAELEELVSTLATKPTRAKKGRPKAKKRKAK
ncbi:pesticin [Acidobacteria bacterium AB60]|nr:pesticin [Acidobacteria bacterium AB60]